MGISTGNPTWEDFPSTNTPITADSLNRIETAIDGSMPGADDNYVTDAEKAALHTHPAVIAQGATAAAARAAIGAGTSDLVIGTTSTTAKAGNYAPPAATTTARGIVELATTAEATTGTDTARAVTPAALKAVADTKANATHSHAPADITGTAVITTDPRLSDARTPTAHSHAIAQVTGLQTALDGKQAAGSYAPATHTHTASQVSDSTATGRSVLTAADAAAARTAIGAGTSSLTIGTTASTAKAGNYAPPSASTTVQGVVELATNTEATTGTDTTRAVTPAGVKAVADTKANASHSHTAAQVSGLATVATSGSYADLTNKPTIPDSPDDIGAAPATHSHVLADITDYTPPDPGGFKVYTSWAEVDAETEPVMGVLTTNDWAPAGHTHDGPRDAPFFITTQAQTDAAGVWRRQELRMWDGWSGVTAWRVREFSPYDGSWWAWHDVTLGNLPDALQASLASAEDAVVRLSTADFNNPKAPYVVGYRITDWRDLTGFAELPTNDWAVGHVFHGGHPTDYGTGYWVQTVVVALEDGTSRTITRVSTNGTSYGAWTLQPTIPATQPINAQTGAYTLVASDAGKLVTVTAATAVDVTVPSGVFTAGQRVDVLDLGAERVTFVAGSGMTLNGTPTLVSRDQYSAHTVVFLSATQAVVVGDLES